MAQNKTVAEVTQKIASDITHRNICFTVFNDAEKQMFILDAEETDAEVSGVILFPETNTLKKNINYCIIGIEICPDTKNIHYQGYMEFNKSIRFSKIKKIFPTMHIEKRRGTAQQASDYCKKDGKFYVFGEISNQGKKTTINHTKEVLKLKSAEEAKEYLIDNLSTRYILSYNNVKSFINDNFKEEKSYLYKSPYSNFINTDIFNEFISNLYVNKDRYKLFVCIGGTCMGKTQYIRSIGRHIYFRSYVNFEEYKNCDKVDYIVWDDITLDLNYMNKIKGILLSMGDNVLTDKYSKKFNANVNKPHILILNTAIELNDYWLSNIVCINVNSKLY